MSKVREVVDGKTGQVVAYITGEWTTDKHGPIFQPREATEAEFRAQQQQEEQS